MKLAQITLWSNDGQMDLFAHAADIHNEAWYLSKRQLFDCKICRFQTSVTAGTIFHGTHTPLVNWYWVLYHMAMDKVGVSVAEMQRLLDIKQYRTAWLMAHKIRKAMADRDARYSLASLVEIDDSFSDPRERSEDEGASERERFFARYLFIEIVKGRNILFLPTCKW